MTAEELAEATGLSLEEAQVIIALRQKKDPVGRLKKAMEALRAAEKKVGVKHYGEEE